MDDGTCRGQERDTDRVHDRVLHIEEPRFERTETDSLVRAPDTDRLEPRCRALLVIIHLVLDERQGEVAADDGRITELLEQDRRPADVVEVSVREDHAADTLLFALEVVHVRDDIVHARHILFRPLHAHIDDDDVVTVFEDGHVPSDLFLTTERDDAEMVPRRRKIVRDVSTLRSRQFYLHRKLLPSTAATA